MEKSKTIDLVSLPTGVFLIFLTLKLLGLGIVKDWSWIWVFSPLWIPFALIVTIVIIVMTFKIIVITIEHVITYVSKKLKK